MLPHRRVCGGQAEMLWHSWGADSQVGGVPAHLSAAGHCHWGPGWHGLVVYCVPALLGAFSDWHPAAAAGGPCERQASASSLPGTAHGLLVWLLCLSAAGRLLVRAQPRAPLQPPEYRPAACLSPSAGTAAT